MFEGSFHGNQRYQRRERSQALPVNTLATGLNCFDRKFLQNAHNSDQDAVCVFEDGPSQRREQQVGLFCNGRTAPKLTRKR